MVALFYYVGEKVSGPNARNTLFKPSNYTLWTVFHWHSLCFELFRYNCLSGNPNLRMILSKYSFTKLYLPGTD